MNNEKRLFYLFWGVGSLALVIIAFCTTGSGGGGDSVLHYLYAKYAFKHPENLLNHWAKPVFTLLASPFTFIGFSGIKLFNVICSSTSVWLSYKLLENWETKNRWVIAPILLSITLFITVTLSGLTEPLSALILISAVYFLSKQKVSLALVIISFMPFVRSEGLIIVAVFLVYLIVKKYFKYIPFLATGHLVYALAGYPYYHDILWIFTKIPYANQTASYGKGNWDHFLIQLNFQTNPIIYALFWLGCIGLLGKLILSFKSLNKVSGFAQKFWLVYGCFFAFSIAHVTFWALGIFNSMGLVRVFVSVMPLMGLICVDGLNLIVESINHEKLKKLASLFTYIIVAAIVIFPFTKGKYGYKIPNDFVMSKEQAVIANTLKPYLATNWPNKSIVFTDPNIPYVLNLDPFDGLACEWYYDLKKPSNLPSNKLLIADAWFSEIEWGYPIENILKDSTLVFESAFPKQAGVYYVFSKKNIQIQ